MFSAKGSTMPYTTTTHGTLKNVQTSTQLQRRETQNFHVLTKEILDGDGT
jgi:hypothetical protein